ncbi:homocysteine-responsive endoplasmic reticulum-resident ubiquitin-like domain member 2 protein isoform X2 [Eucyclogobius newberryi]|uniref:homocysteine-responsive endoplasmic reticulum-resident ubiquitin-like domain member 2 protein isoform X2 n=1 Tax=Eucyclogobius newberryi TaxID=166745 RepID=UPI003B5BD6BF
MDPGVVENPVTLVIKAPNQKYGDQTINCFQNWTVEKLKAHLSNVYPSKPSCKDQRLVYSGKLLLDHLTLKDVLRKQDEYHMLHLVCASRTPPESPKPTSSSSSTSSTSSSRPQSQQSPDPVSPNSPSPLQNSPSSPGETSDGLRQRPPFPYPHMYPGFMHSWSQMPPPPSQTPVYYHHMSLMWWQQLYAQQFLMHYHLMAASQHMSLDQTSPLSNQSHSQNHRAQADRHGNPEVQMNAQGGEVLNDEDLNRDWLDWVYTFSRAAILLSIVYFYSSFSRFVMVLVAMVVLYLHQAGWFPFNLDNELLGDRPNLDEGEEEPLNQDLPEMDGAADDGSDEEGDSAADGAEDPDSGPQNGFLSSTWSFIITFFMSLIPEGPANAAN